MRLRDAPAGDVMDHETEHQHVDRSVREARQLAPIVDDLLDLRIDDGVQHFRRDVDGDETRRRGRVVGETPTVAHVDHDPVGDERGQVPRRLLVEHAPRLGRILVARRDAVEMLLFVVDHRAIAANPLAQRANGLAQNTRSTAAHTWSGHPAPRFQT